MKKLFILTILVCAVTIFAQNAWLNEIHYDNASTDEGEFLEIVIEDEKDVSLVEKLLSKLDRGKKERKEIEAVMALSKPYQRVIEAIKRAELGKCYKVREIYKMAGYSGEVVWLLTHQEKKLVHPE